MEAGQVLNYAILNWIDQLHMKIKNLISSKWRGKAEVEERLASLYGVGDVGSETT